MKHPLARSVSLTATAALLVLPIATAGAATPEQSGHDNGGARSDSARAASSYQSLETYLAVSDGSGLYHEQYPVATGDNSYSYEWPFSQAHIALADLANQPGARGQEFKIGLKAVDAAQEHYWKADGGSTGLPGYASYTVGPYGGGGDFFYDDNEWVGLLDVQRYLTDDDHAALGRAKQIFDLVVSGWDSDPSHAKPGGVFWTQAPWSTDRNTVSNMPAAQLGLRLFQITGQRSYLDWSLRMYKWTNDYLQSPEGLYYDHMDLAGRVEPTIWSYNQGVPVGVNVLLYEVTHDRRYLDEAKRVAAAAYRYYVSEGRLAAQPAYFNSIFFKNLLLLESVTGGSKYRRAMQDYGDQVWANNRDATTGLFTFNSGSMQLLDQSAMVQIYAVLGWSPSQWRHLY